MVFCFGVLTGATVSTRAGFVLILQNHKSVQIGTDRQFTQQAGQYACYSVAMPIVSDYFATQGLPYVDVRMYLDLALLRQVAQELKENGFEFGQMNGENVANADSELMQLFALLVDLFDKPKDIAILAPPLKKMIYYYLLTGKQGAMLYEMVNKNSHLNKITQAVDWLKQHYNEPFDVHHLASRLGMSSSGFYAYFREFVGTSPLQYQKSLRLFEAKRLILIKEKNLSQIAYEVGYESVSQFSREYKRQFGVSPSLDK